MFGKLLKNDLKKNLWRNMTLLLFMTVSAAIAVSVCVMLTQLFTSLSTMYGTAKPPHFLQMHKGELNQADIDAFNAGYPGIEHWQTVPMIDVYGETLSVASPTGHTYDLSDCRLDISLVRQNDAYDLLLDENRHKLEMRPGEIGVPVILLEQYDIEIGDTITLRNEKTEQSFQVSNYVYDAQMNSTLCSSTRFLISDADFTELFGQVGETEYLIEAYFTDSALASGYQTAYEQSESNLPKDGQAVTYPMIFLLSAMTDMMMAMVFLLAGILLSVIALLCLRYCLLTELEEDAKEIGTMKAIGIPENGIHSLYLHKIRILMAVGSFAGLLLAACCSSFFTAHMRQTFGNQNISPMCCLAAVAVCILLYGLVMLFARHLLRKLHAVTIVDLLVTEKGFSKAHRVNDGLHRAKHLPINLLVGLHEARQGYGMIFMLLLLLSFLMLTPYRTAGSMASREFVTYMGSPLCDVLLEVEQGNGLEERRTAAEELLYTEPEVSCFDILRRVRLQAIDAQGEPVGIHIDTGIHSGSGLQYLSGGAPASDTEIALSSLMAEEVETAVGDPLLLIVDGEQQEYTVSGIYQDVTSGGRTAKMICDFTGEPAEQYTFQIQMDTGADLRVCMERWRTKLGTGYSIEDMAQFIHQTLGGVSAQVKRASGLVIFLGLCLAGLMVLLFIKLRIAREMGALATKQAIGLSFRDIVLQELYPIVLTGGSGILTGIILTELIGERLVSTLLSILGIGLERVTFSPFPLLSVAGWMAALLAVCSAVTCLSCHQLRKMHPASYLNE